MTLGNALKRITKLNLEITGKNQTWDGHEYYIKLGGHTLSFYSLPDWQDESKTVVDNFCITNTRALELDKNPMNGNCYNSFYSNLSQALRSFTNK